MVIALFHHLHVYHYSMQSMVSSFGEISEYSLPLPYFTLLHVLTKSMNEKLHYYRSLYWNVKEFSIDFHRQAQVALIRYSEKVKLALLSFIKKEIQ